MKLPKISIILVSLNSERTIEDCLSYIEKQTYPHIDEVIIVDGGSTDETLNIIKSHKKLPIKVIHGGYKKNQEARRAIALTEAKHDICVSLDTDNYMLDRNWIKDMVEPLLEHPDIVASQTLRYAVPKNTTAMNRYFGLLGAADQVAYYLGKADRLSWMHEHWNLLGNIVEDNKKYYIIAFDTDGFPTLGCNGLVIRKSLLMKSNWGKPENYFHTDVFVDVAILGYNKFAIVKNEIFHNTAEEYVTFMKKRTDYMSMHHQNLRTKRRYVIFDPKNIKDITKLLLFLFFTITLIEPFIVSIRGYLKKRDVAWFLHPLVCLGIAYAYGRATITNQLNKYMR